MRTNSLIVGIVLSSAMIMAPSFRTTAAECTERSVKLAIDPEQKINQYIYGNLFGIQNVKKDAKKRIVSVIAIGRAPLSSAISKARAKNQAFKKADANARAEFMKWLTTAVVYTRVDQDDVAIVQKGEALGDAGAGKSAETGEAVELSQEQVVSVAAGFVKGMVQIGAGMNDDGEAVVVLGWNADTADRMDSVRDKNVPRAPQKVREHEKTNGPTHGVNGTPRKQTSVSDAATDFL